MTPAEAKAAYKGIAKASCNWAQRDGVVEVGDGYSAVMTNSTQAYKGFTEASLVAPDAYKVLFDLGDFQACADWYLFSMADEAGKDAAIEVTFNSDASFNVHKVLASGAASALKMIVANGAIATATNLDPADPWVHACRYGSLTVADLQILKTAVERRAAAN
jgi:phosphoserine aminotransferase